MQGKCAYHPAGSNATSPPAAAQGSCADTLRYVCRSKTPAPPSPPRPPPRPPARPIYGSDDYTYRLSFKPEDYANASTACRDAKAEMAPYDEFVS